MTDESVSYVCELGVNLYKYSAVSGGDVRWIAKSKTRAGTFGWKIETGRANEFSITQSLLGKMVRL